MRIMPIWATLTVLPLVSCSGHSGLPAPTSVQGSYEFVVTSNVTGGVTLFEANLSANGNQSSAAGPSQVQVVTFEKKIWYLNGVCAGTAPGNNSVSGVLAGNNIGLTFNEGGNPWTGQGVLTGAMITGNYSLTGSTCPDLQGLTGWPDGYDAGGFVGNQVPQLAGTFAGTLNLRTGTDNVALTLMENPDQSLAVNAVFTGPSDNGTFSFTGSAVGNIMFVSGVVSGTNLSLFGYFDRAGSFTKYPNSLLVFDYDTQANAGLLLAQ